MVALILLQEDLSGLLSNVDSVLPVAALVFIYGAVEAIKVFYYRKNGPDSSLPWWFPLIPGALGLMYGLLDFFVLTSTPDLQAMSIAKKVLGALKMGLGYGGASILVYQLRKGWSSRKEE